MASATRKTQGPERRRHLQPEAEIEKLLAAYPYLIQPGLHRPERQHSPTRHDRIDLLFRHATPPLVVEIKAVRCGVPSVRQLIRYLDILEAQHPEVRGILIGQGLSKGARRLLHGLQPRVTFLRLEQDVPTPATVVFCSVCRMAYSGGKVTCPNGHSGII